MNCQLKQAACSSGCETAFPPVHLTDPKIDVWLHDVSPDTQSRDHVSRRCEQSCSTQTFLPDAGFSIRTGKRSVGKVRAPKPLARCRVPYGALPVYQPQRCDSYAVVPLSSPWLKPGASRGLIW